MLIRPTLTKIGAIFDLHEKRPSEKWTNVFLLGEGGGGQKTPPFRAVVLAIGSTSN